MTRSHSLTVTWGNVLDVLAQWHEHQEAAVGRAALRFIEEELRLMIPGLVRRSWPEHLIEDALQDLLERIVRKRLPDHVRQAQWFFRRVFRNQCIDALRKEDRRRETLVEARPDDWSSWDDSGPTPLEVMLQHEESERLQAAFARLSIADQVTIKLLAEPEWITPQEILWLAERDKHSGASPEQVGEAIRAAEDVHALSRVFYPGQDDPNDADLRRLQMERFRRRRARAREKFKALSEEGGE